MKKLLFVVAAIGCFVSFSTPSLAQWTTVTGGINYSGGKVGIGNATPYGMLHFVTSHNNRKIVLSSAAGVNNEHEFYGMGTSTDVFRFHIPSATRAFRFFRADDATSSTEIFTVLGSGNVGVGTASPGSKLHIVGPEVRIQDANRGKLQFYDNTGGNIGYSVRTAAGGGWAWQFVDGTNKVYFHVDYAKESVGIGTTSTGSYKLAVAGKVAAWQEVKVFNPSTAFPDYVFAPTYELRSLTEVARYIQENRHLPEVPSAAEVEREGMSLVEMNTIAIKKIEELTLYLIEQNNRLEQQEKMLEALQQQNQALKLENEQIKTAFERFK